MARKLLDFAAEWCSPCQVMTPLAKKLAAEYDLELEIIDIDVDQKTAAIYGVNGIPTFVLLEDGQEVGRTTGSTPYGLLVNRLGLTSP